MKTRDLLEKAITHVIQQGVPSIDRNYNCKYKNSKGLMCAVGCLIAAEKYKKSLEGKLVNHPKIILVLEESLGRQLGEQELDYLRELQVCHDYGVCKEDFLETFTKRVKIKVEAKQLPEYCLDFIK
jgi:hypothetical protein